VPAIGAGSSGRTVNWNVNYAKRIAANFENRRMQINIGFLQRFGLIESD
jgi:hypothetical protein